MEFVNNIKFIKEQITLWQGNIKRQHMINAKKYYEGNNVTINNVKKIIVVNEGGEYVRKANPFVSNYQIANNFVQDMVDQKVFALLDKQPKVTGVNKVVEDYMMNILDYDLQQMAIEASLCGNAFAYVNIVKDKLKFKVFNSQDCIPFYDDLSEELTALIRYIGILADKKEYIEVYYDRYYLYSKNTEDKNSDYILEKSEAFISKIKGNDYADEIEESEWEKGLPIIEMHNNKDKKSDFTKSIRSQIDAIDIVLSDFANNLADFQDVFWVVKGLDEISAEEMGNFLETIKTTYKALLPEGADIDMKQIDIPYEARKEFVDQIKKQLISNTGVMDSELMLTGGLTATAIKVASQKLALRVSKFEYEVYQAALNMVEFAKEYFKDTATEVLTIKFLKAFITNDTEIITNLNNSLPNISQQTYLENHPYIENVDEELERLDAEVVSNYNVTGDIVE